MKRLTNKTNKIINSCTDLYKDLFFQSLPEIDKQALYNAVNNLRTLRDNLPKK